MVNVQILSNLVLHILNELPRHEPNIDGYALLSLVQDRTRDSSLKPHDINDAVIFLKLRRAIVLLKALGTAPFNFAQVRISVLGRNALQADEGIFLEKKTEAERPSIQVPHEIKRLVNKLISEENENLWIVLVKEIVDRFGSQAVDEITHAIKVDPKNEPDNYGIVSTKGSVKWNSLALTYLQKNHLSDSVTIFEELIQHEPDNPATQNNFGVALLRVGYNNKSILSRAKNLFTNAYESDQKQVSRDAKELPAYKNLMAIENQLPKTHGINVVGSSPIHNYILFMDIVGFSRPTWFGMKQVEKINYLTDITRTLLTDLELNYRFLPMIPTGDGMVLFFDHVEHPLDFARMITDQLSRDNEQLDADMKVELRIGIHAGESFQVLDLHHGGNRCGPAITTARRIMDLGDRGHILCSYDYGDNLVLLFGPTAKEILHDCGVYTSKHDVKIEIYNIYDDSIGNSKCPKPTSS